MQGESCSPFQLPAARLMSALEFAEKLLELIQLANPVKPFADVGIWISLGGGPLTEGGGRTVLLGFGTEKKGFGGNECVLIVLARLNSVSVKENEHVEGNTAPASWCPELSWITEGRKEKVGICGKGHWTG